MSKQYFNFGVGWVKTDQSGKSYISCKANSEANDKGNVRLQAVAANGEVQNIESFVVFYNDNKEKESHPDVRFTFSIEN